MTPDVSALILLVRELRAHARAVRSMKARGLVDAQLVEPVDLEKWADTIEAHLGSLHQVEAN